MLLVFKSALRADHDLIPVSAILQAPSMMSDKYSTTEGFHGLAWAYRNVPDLHIMWLLYLCDAHQQNQSWAEAAQCAVAVAGVVMQVILTT